MAKCSFLNLLLLPQWLINVFLNCSLSFLNFVLFDEIMSLIKSEMCEIFSYFVVPKFYEFVPFCTQNTWKNTPGTGHGYPLPTSSCNRGLQISLADVCNCSWFLVTMVFKYLTPTTVTRNQPRLRLRDVTGRQPQLQDSHGKLTITTDI